MHNVDQISLGRHDGVDILVRLRSFVDYVLISTTFNSDSGSIVVGQSETPLGFSAGHRSASTVATGMETLRISLSANNEGLGSHRSRNDPKVASSGADGALSCNP